MRGPILIAKQNLISIRDYTPSDQNFILTTWMRGLHEDNDIFSKIKKRTFFEHYERAIKFILSQKQIIARIAVLKEDPDVILGYAILDKPKHHRLHWIYVKHLWRRIGIARDLLEPFDIRSVTHLTHFVEPFKPTHMVFNPFI